MIHILIGSNEYLIFWLANKQDVHEYDNIATRELAERGNGFSDCFSNGGPSTGGRVTLQDIVRSDPGYTPNIEHLVFPERKSSNPNLAKTGDESPPNKSKSNATNSGRSRLAEVFSRHYSRGSSQDSSVTSRKNHLNVSVR